MPRLRFGLCLRLVRRNFYTILINVLFFFSSRKRHTRWQRDWSSDVCYSDLNSFSQENISHKASHIYRIGGYYIPQYNDITNYFNRITFRAGLRYQETGMTINQQDIDEFGISFGLGLPAGRFMSKIGRASCRERRYDQVTVVML